MTSHPLIKKSKIHDLPSGYNSNLPLILENSTLAPCVFLLFREYFSTCSQIGACLWICRDRQSAEDCSPIVSRFLLISFSKSLQMSSQEASLTHQPKTVPSAPFYPLIFLHSTYYCCWLVTKSCPTACNSMGCSRQEHCSGLPVPLPGDLPDPRTEPTSPTQQADSLPMSH